MKGKYFFLTLILLFSNLHLIYANETLTILCGITMKNAMEEITAEFAKEHKVKFEISYAGSNDLLKTIQASKIGDIFLPGSDNFIKELEKTGEVIETKFAGENKAVLVVKKGNPLKIKSIKDLTNKKFRVVIAKADSGSIGKETDKILKKANIVNEVNNNVIYYAQDSKDLIKAMINDEADLTINWRAITRLPENRQFMDIIEIAEAEPEKLVFGLLKYSKNKDLAKKFIDYATSPKGKAIFQKYGF